jgi:hypothetical protein
MRFIYFFIAFILSVTISAQNDITFSVDMSLYGNSFNTVYVSGEFNGWSGTSNAMTDLGGGNWSTTISLADGEYEYRFSHDDWVGQDNLSSGEACTITNNGFINRYLYVNGANKILDKPFFSECYDDGNNGPHDTTFTIDMSAYAGAFNTVYVSGQFNAWSGTANPLVNMGGGIWTVTLSLPESSLEFKFSVDDWNDQEFFNTGDEGTVTNGGFTNRYLSVLNQQSRSYIWNSEGSTLGTYQVDVNDSSNLDIYPNPTYSVWNVSDISSVIDFVKVYDIIGNQVLSFAPNSSEVSIDGSTFKSGIYFVVIQSKNKLSRLKLIRK